MPTVARTVIAWHAYESKELKRFTRGILSPVLPFFLIEHSRKLRIINIKKIISCFALHFFPFLFFPSIACLDFPNYYPFHIPQPPKMNISEVNRIHYARHVLHLLLPLLRKLLQEQMEEKELEAKVKGTMFCCCMTHSGNWVALHANLFLSAGVLVNEVRLEQAKCNLDERVYWFGPSTSSFP